MKRTIFIIAALLFWLIAFISCKEPNKPPERKRYAVIPVIEYVEYDSVYTTLTEVPSENGIGSAWYGIHHKTVTVIQHSFDTVLIRQKDNQYFLNY